LKSGKFDFKSQSFGNSAERTIPQIEGPLAGTERFFVECDAAHAPAGDKMPENGYLLVLQSLLHLAVWTFRVGVVAVEQFCVKYAQNQRQRS
jgi:hypothetical protein